MRTYRVTFSIGLRDNQQSRETVSSVTAWIERAVEQQLERGETLHPVIVKDVTDVASDRNAVSAKPWAFQNPNPPTDTDLQAMCKSILGVQP